ncbi:hypothetical protein OG897_13220 [Streptomyces sp. NBC_00237]|uniref:tyrosine-type recombinase/integrase n=1 Tax=Streptomyces sp. NBC_00237 TaxID=2975687 RepID=UPI00224F49E6|nr:hypothetical protein [Streptomyces sp. NBC_00237]MCX5202403.1 hypothetical protein [Streptomyces sp. NBC_00237]
MAYSEKRSYDKTLRKWRYRGKYKLPNGRYGSVSRDDEGKPFYTGNAAKSFAAGLETDVARKTFVNPRDGRITVAEWADLWIESIDVGPLTDEKYRGRLRSVILPRWGPVAMGDVTALAYNTWENELREQGYKRNSIQGYRSVLRLMMTDAVASKVRSDNPVPSRQGSRRGKFVPKPKEDERTIGTPRQALLMARNALEVRGFSHFVLILTVAYTGMRIAEISGLERDRLILPVRRPDVEVPDVPLAQSGFAMPDTRRWKQWPGGSRILLTSQSQYVDSKPTLIPAKYGSARSLILPPFLADLLVQLTESHDGTFVFRAPRGGRLLIEKFFYSDSWHPAAAGRPPKERSRGKRAKPGVRPVLGIEDIEPHDWRHSHKVWLDEAGHPRVAVEARMGHDLPGVEGTYSHTTLAMELKIAESLQSLWEDSLRPVIDRREYGPIPRENP